MNVNITKKGRFLTLVLCMCMILFTCTYSVNAEPTKENGQDVSSEEFLKTSIFDETYSGGVYKTSDEKNRYLPFLRYSLDRIIVDEEVNNSGIMYARKAIEVNKPMNRMQVLFSTETVRVNAPLENAIILSTGNVIIDSTIDKTVVILANDTVTITEKGKIDGDVICLSNNLDIKGTVTGSVLGSATKTNVTGKIQKDLRLKTSEISFSSKENVDNGIYIDTYNKNLNIKENYPNAVVNIAKESNNTITSPMVLLSGLTTCLIFTLLYLLVQKITRKKLFDNLKQRTSKYPVFTLIGGAITILIMPVVILLLFVLSLVGLGVITIPALFTYVSLIVVAASLSIFIVGGTMIKYMREKYIKDGGMGTDILTAFVIFAVLFILTKIPFIGGYVAILLSMIAIGMIITTLFKKSKMEKQDDNKVVKKD